jgi:hypothetical protein
MQGQTDVLLTNTARTLYPSQCPAGRPRHARHGADDAGRFVRTSEIAPATGLSRQTVLRINENPVKAMRALEA